MGFYFSCFLTCTQRWLLALLQPFRVPLGTSVSSLWSLVLAFASQLVISGPQYGHHNSEHRAHIEERKGSSSYASSLSLENKNFPRTHLAPPHRLPLTQNWLGACPTAIPCCKGCINIMVPAVHRGARAVLHPRLLWKHVPSRSATASVLLCGPGLCKGFPESSPRRGTTLSEHVHENQKTLSLPAASGNGEACRMRLSVVPVSHVATNK